MNNSELVMKVFLLLCFLAFRLISTGMAYAQEKKKENNIRISKRKRLILLKEMAQRGVTQKYYTHPIYTEVEKTIKRYVKVMKDGNGELSQVAQVFLLRMAEKFTAIFRLNTCCRPASEKNMYSPVQADNFFKSSI